MTLSMDAFKAAKKRAGSKCIMAQIRDALDPKDRVALDTALRDGSITGAAISRVLEAAGHPVSPNSVAHHRRGDCRCEKDGT